MNHNFWIAPAQRIRLWGYVSTFSVLVMESILFALWYQALFNPHALAWAGILLIQMAILGIPLLITRRAEALHWKLLIRQSILLCWMLVAIFASMKLLLFTDVPIGLVNLIAQPVHFILQGDFGDLAFYHLIAIAIITWRGVALARSSVTTSETNASLHVGLLFLLLYGMLFAPFHPVEASFGLYTFLFFSLIAMATARIANLSDLRGGRIPRFGRGWILSILGAALAAVGLAVLTGRLISERVIQVFSTILFVIYGVLTTLFLLVLSPFLGLLAKMFLQMMEIIRSIINMLLSLANNPGLIRLMNQLNVEIEKIQTIFQISRTFALALVILVIFISILVGMRLRARFRNRAQEESETGQAGREGGNNLLNLLRRFFENGRKLRLHRPGQMLAAARIRLIYQQLMQLSRKLGKERPLSRTPFEFLPDLQTLLPGEQDGLGLITGAYVKIRYGAYPETMGEVEAVEAAWERVRREARSLMAARKRRKA